jgi:predicted 3-demethylubiquinone-9 3-methyltransferase (glyoxalase superfamily)
MRINFGNLVAKNAIRTIIEQNFQNRARLNNIDNYVIIFKNSQLQKVELFEYAEKGDGKMKVADLARKSHNTADIRNTPRHSVKRSSCDV